MSELPPDRFSEASFFPRFQVQFCCEHRPERTSVSVHTFPESGLNRSKFVPLFYPRQTQVVHSEHWAFRRVNCVTLITIYLGDRRCYLEPVTRPDWRTTPKLMTAQISSPKKANVSLLSSLCDPYKKPGLSKPDIERQSDPYSSASRYQHIFGSRTRC